MKLDPKTPSLRLALADACLRAGKKQRAGELIKAILAADPKYPGAVELQKQLEPTKEPKKP